MEKIKCSKCREEMPKLRLDNYGYDFCVECSDVKPKVGRIRVIGEGDYTVTELDILDQDTAVKLQELENTARGVRNIPLEVLNFDEDELGDDAKVVEAVVEKVLDDELEEEFIEEEEEEVLDEEDLEDLDDLEDEDE
jgi:hypothetical protein